MRRSCARRTCGRSCSRCSSRRRWLDARRAPVEGGAVAITSPVPEDEPRKGPPETLILIVFAVLTLAASAFVIGRAEHKALHDPAQQGSRGEVKGLDALSFFRAQNLRK